MNLAKWDLPRTQHDCKYQARIKVTDNDKRTLILKVESVTAVKGLVPYESFQTSLIFVRKASAYNPIRLHYGGLSFISHIALIPKPNIIKP